MYNCAKACILILITISALAQNHPQSAPQPQADQHGQTVQPNNEQVMPQPVSVQPIVVQPVAVQQPPQPLPNVVNPEPIIQAGVNVPMPQPIVVQPVAPEAGTQAQPQQAVEQTQHQGQQQAHQQTVQVSAQPAAQQHQTEQTVHVSHQINHQQPQLHNTQQPQQQNTQHQQQQQPQQPPQHHQQQQNTQQQPQQHQQQQDTQHQQQQQQQLNTQGQQHAQPESGQPNKEYRRNVAVGQQQNHPNYDNPDAQRSAKYKAEQERLNQIRRKQKQLQQKRAHQMGVGPNPNIEVDRTHFNKNQMARNKQRQALHSLLKDQLESGITFPKKTVMFQVDKQIQQYALNPTSDIQITLRMLIYTLENNAYGFVKDIDKSKSLKVYVYEDNTRIVAQTEFYFETAVKFLGKAGSNYVIRFYNDGVLKLVSLTYPNILEALQMQSLYSKQKGLQQITKTQMLSTRIEQVTQRLRRNSLMDRINNETMMGFLQKYSGYQFIEMLIVIIVSAFQVHLVKNMFQTDSIL